MANRDFLLPTEGVYKLVGPVDEVGHNEEEKSLACILAPPHNTHLDHTECENSGGCARVVWLSYLKDGSD